MPAKATSVTATLRSGRTVTGSRDGDLFLIWAPGADVEGARLTASGPNGKVIATTTAPRVDA
ncbi:hypothetical protein [Actinoplanes palleronii]|uniref:hypothetical protein n=1 Tax=Actinoplanes palleronii TaxID=113570 RepID=UPI001944C4C3|nr:hypothetical protein [Actinoplanes palleronii]